MSASANPAESSMVRALNRDCRCIGADLPALRRCLDQSLPGEAARAGLFEARPHLFAAHPVFLSRAELDAMASVVAACEHVSVHPEFGASALSRAPSIAREDPGPRGAFVGYDFHLGENGPRLIEINTNPGGGLLCAHLARAQRACCREIEARLRDPIDLERLERDWVSMFESEWRRHDASRPLATVAIVDDDPPAQFLYPEMLLFAQLFERSGIEARVVDPRDLSFEGSAKPTLRMGRSAVDLVYNRLTDFYLQASEHAALAAAYRTRAAAFAPGPHAHAIYSNKRNLVWLSDPKQLECWGIDGSVAEVLGTGVPKTRLVTPENAEALWADRRRLFFEPIAGHGSRGVYRGSKLTRRVWRSIVASDYIAQRRIAPSERTLRVEGERRNLKLDVRCFAYAGRPQLFAARLYRGQVTNLRSAGGGLASVLTPFRSAH